MRKSKKARKAVETHSTAFRPAPGEGEDRSKDSTRHGGQGQAGRPPESGESKGWNQHYPGQSGPPSEES